jgi:hypothetical protein
MSIPQPPKPAKLVIGVIIRDRAVLARLAGDLAQRFGPVDMVSPWFDFDYTNYYKREMGAPLYRRMFSFADLIRQRNLARIKLATNEMEKAESVGDRRRFNIDPGYLVYERWVLATGKNYSHRIYLERGIYADLTLIFQKGGYRALPWTYPDYAQPDLQRFLLQVRRRYATDLQREQSDDRGEQPQ